MTCFELKLTIDRLGERGEGVARTPDDMVFVPYALAGETISAEIDRSRGKLVEVIAPSPDRIAPHCRYFSHCGGCAVQTLAAPAYARWKRDLVVDALRHAGLTAEVLDLVDAHGHGRRRATFHARYPEDRPAIGFMQARAHKIVEIDSCPLLTPSLENALPVARAIGEALAAAKKPLDILVTATASGLDVDVKGHGPLDDAQRQALVGIALAHDLARLSNHGDIIVTKHTPLVGVGKAMVALPPGAFLQATEAGEEALATRVCAELAGARRIADLFSGIGTFALRLAEFAAVTAFDLDKGALSALAKAAHTAQFKPVKAARRDLFRKPLSPKELENFDAAVFDPPRAGAESQARALAASSIPLVAGVSCNAKTFARDAAILCGGGFELIHVEPIDQFRHTPHVEIVACFRRLRPPQRRRRSLLS
ncbi:MAG TPA: class I SAM-dependent RNA methyltransferase [Methylocella sp.]|nr:class I SAM-dependent RNA methyltransferase [Methylocella sp.]